MYRYVLLVAVLVAALLPPSFVSAQGATFACTEMIGFSQSAEWYQFGGFESHVDDGAYQLLWNSGASVEKWIDPDYPGWSEPIRSACSDPTVERVVFNISGPGRELDRWVSDIRKAVATVRGKRPNATQIVLEPVVGGPDHADCGTRASANHPVIDQAITEVVAAEPGTAAGLSPEVARCDQYYDTTGHLTTAGEQHVAAEMGAFYNGGGAGGEPLPPDDGVVSVVRIAGADRFGTAAALALETFDAGMERLYLATGMDFPDGLAAGAVAGQGPWPVLLATRDDLPAATAEALQQLRPRQLVVVGGTAAISDEVAQRASAAADGASVQRIHGADRFETAAELARGFRPDEIDVVFVATGLTFPDALTGSVAAAVNGAPILLVTAHDVPSTTREAIDALAPGRIVVLGGPEAVSDEVIASLEDHTTGTVSRWAGATRFETAVVVAGCLFDARAPNVHLTTAATFPDALASGPAAVAAGGPVLVTDPATLPDPVGDELARLGPGQLTVVGGTAAVAEAVAEAAADAAGHANRAGDNTCPS